MLGNVCLCVRMFTSLAQEQMHGLDVLSYSTSESVNTVSPKVGTLHRGPQTQNLDYLENGSRDFEMSMICLCPLRNKTPYVTSLEINGALSDCAVASCLFFSEMS
jgi:hypothetical protein